MKLVHHESRQLKQRYGLTAYNQMNKFLIRLIDPNPGLSARKHRALSPPSGAAAWKHFASFTLSRNRVHSKPWFAGSNQIVFMG